MYATRTRVWTRVHSCFFKLTHTRTGQDAEQRLLIATAALNGKDHALMEKEREVADKDERIRKLGMHACVSRRACVSVRVCLYVPSAFKRTYEAGWIFGRGRVLLEK